jgi:16S rRNA (guanine527-N7)-methyltransferase
MIDRDGFAAQFGVPRETIALFDLYANLLADWQTRMNLVGPSTLPFVWNRHFADSAQLLTLVGRGRSWLDIGAGAGFPGLVLAILDGDARFTLVESISKKCRFLQEAAGALGVLDRVTIVNQRIEELKRQKFDIITARALANLAQLFDWGLPYAGSGTRWILPKGARAAGEIELADRHFTFDHELLPSLTDPDARIVLASGVKHR